jgi:branched-chain amino acid transport system substrate-binding protein
VPLKKNYFALQPSYQMEGKLLAQYVAGEVKPSRVAVFVVDDPFGNEGSKTFIDEMAKAGMKNVHVIKHQPGESNPEKWVADLQACKPDLVLLYTYVIPTAELLMKAYALNFKPKWLGTYVVSGKEWIKYAGEEATHGIITTCYPKGPIYDRGPRLFQMLMQREYGSDVTIGTESVIGYAAAQLVVEGLKNAGPDLTREGFMNALENLKDWTGGLLPPISYSKTDHRGMTGLALQRAIHGKWMQEKSLLLVKD